MDNGINIKFSIVDVEIKRPSSIKKIFVNTQIGKIYRI